MKGTGVVVLVYGVGNQTGFLSRQIMGAHHANTILPKGIHDKKETFKNAWCGPR